MQGQVVLKEVEELLGYLQKAFKNPKGALFNGDAKAFWYKLLKSDTKCEDGSQRDVDLTQGEFLDALQKMRFLDLTNPKRDAKVCKRIFFFIDSGDEGFVRWEHFEIIHELLQGTRKTGISRDPEPEIEK